MTKKTIENLRLWFLHSRRALPWRDFPSPYAVWVSEVMLQQTQVSVVISYFQRWMERFPTIHALATAPLDDVLKLWEGLGYYSRARNLHAGAQQVVELYNGRLPKEREQLQTIKGLGDYTIGAIQAFAFKKRAAAVDGNVLRVISRFDAIMDPIDRSTTRRHITERVLDILPEESPWEVTEALIELGAMVCKKKPACSTCPLRNSCQAYRQCITDKIPIKSKRSVTTPLYRAVAVLRHGDHYLVQKRAAGEVMADLFEFPYWETTESGWKIDQLSKTIASKFHVSPIRTLPLQKIKHSFTRYKASLTPILIDIAQITTNDQQWHTLENLQRLPFSAGHRQILQQLTRL